LDTGSVETAFGIAGAKAKQKTSANSGIPTYIDDKHAIAHNKIMIVDRTTVITGSFNFTKAAEEKNAENLLIITSADMAKLYLENWMEYKEHSRCIRQGIDPQVRPCYGGWSWWVAVSETRKSNNLHEIEEYTCYS
jgi:phosphatidylserine/phosphatidylglycerophosphate/cardiolipin synthase-like enzyme